MSRRSPPFGDQSGDDPETGAWMCLAPCVTDPDADGTNGSAPTRRISLYDAKRVVVEMVTLAAARRRTWVNPHRWRPSWSDEVPPVCLRCGYRVTPLIQWSYDGKIYEAVTPTSRWCSPQCSTNAYRERERWRLEESGIRVCAYCKSEFEAARRDARFCCVGHKQAAYRKRLSKTKPNRTLRRGK